MPLGLIWIHPLSLSKIGGSGRIRTYGGFLGHSRFQDEYHNPLGHASKTIVYDRMLKTNVLYQHPHPHPPRSSCILLSFMPINIAQIFEKSTENYSN